MYKVVELNPANATSTILETLGTKQKHWLVTDDKQKLLFKVGRPGTGENWAEKVACELCSLLDIPHAEYDFATCQNLEGVVTPSLVSGDQRLVLGNELLAEYKAQQGNVSYYKERHHTLSRVMAVASKVDKPAALTSPVIKDGADTLVGYLLLDALIGNQDRHDENWGIIVSPTEYSPPSKLDIRLAPTYDHASSLGRIETDEKRKQRLAGKDPQHTVEGYLKRSKSAFFLNHSDNRPMGTIEAFEEIAKHRKDAAFYWLDKLFSVRKGDIQHIFTEIPHHLISGLAIEFSLKMLELNQFTLEKVRGSLK